MAPVSIPSARELIAASHTHKQIFNMKLLLRCDVKRFSFFYYRSIPKSFVKAVYDDFQSKFSEPAEKTGFLQYKISY